MNTEQKTIPPEAHMEAALSHRWGRLLVLFAGTQMTISSVLLLTAATARWAQPPRWAQLLDVGLAVSVVVTGMIIDRAGRPHISPRVWRQSYYIATYLPVSIFLALWLGQQAFDFNFLTGVAWRCWVVLYVLPAAVALWGGSHGDTRREQQA